MMPPLLLLLLALAAGVTMATDSAEITPDTSADSICNTDGAAANVCLTCSSLPFQADISLETCCQDTDAFLFCDACINDQESCKAVVAETEALKTMYDEYMGDENDDVTDDDGDLENYNMKDLSDIFHDDNRKVDVQKRFGKLFVASPKRFGRVFFGKRDGNDVDIDMNKRFGRLFTGYGSLYRKGNGKRFGRLFTGSRKLFGKRSFEGEGQLDKRYGRVYMGGLRSGGGRLRLFGKRLYDDDEAETIGEADKRFGRLFTFGKREYDDSSADEAELELSPLDKRYGSLFVSRFKKRNGGDADFVGDDDNDDYDINKRFGTLYMNRMNAWGRPSNRFLLGKRFGRLFTGHRKYLLG